MGGGDEEEKKFPKELFHIVPVSHLFSWGLAESLKNKLHVNIKACLDIEVNFAHYLPSTFPVFHLTSEDKSKQTFLHKTL